MAGLWNSRDGGREDSKGSLKSQLMGPQGPTAFGDRAVWGFRSPALLRLPLQGRPRGRTGAPRREPIFQICVSNTVATRHLLVATDH